jgi:hypothetical protein
VQAWSQYPEDGQANDGKKELFVKDVAREVGNKVQFVVVANNILDM